MTYIVIDTHTDEVKGRYKTRPQANRRADRLDNIYGAYRYAVEVENRV